MSDELFIEASAGTCGNGFCSGETRVPIMDLLPPDVVAKIRERVQTRCDEILARRATEVRRPPQRFVRPDRPSGLYLMKSNDLYKIGVSGAVETRRRALETASGRPVELVAYWPMNTANAFIAEGAWHDYFRHLRRFGEWFDLDSGDVAAMAYSVERGTK